MGLFEEKSKFIQENSPDGGFLQSEEWRKFQESAGRKTFNILSDIFWANIIEHKLPIVGKYLYVPRGPILGHSELDSESIRSRIESGMTSIVNLAKEENAGWIRIEPSNSHVLDLIRKNWRVIKSPHDMQPREILVLDITNSEEELLAEMKSKTRYNIKLAQKHGVKILATCNSQPDSQKYLEKFLELVKITAKRDGITSHPESYYRKMFEIIPPENLKLYVAEYNDKVIAASIVIFYANTATYLHGASDNKYRNVMAPYLLQWQAIMDAKKAGLARYDLGGIKTGSGDNSWTGITRFKIGFLPNTQPVKFPGSYDVILNSSKYKLYKILQTIKNIITAL